MKIRDEIEKAIVKAWNLPPFEDDKLKPLQATYISIEIEKVVKKAFKEWRETLEDLTDEDDCSYDHHGFCKTHSWFETDPICPHKRAKELKKRLDEVEGGEK